MADLNTPLKGVAFDLGFTLYKNDGTVIANPGTYTKKIWKDGGSIADITGSVTETDTTYGVCVLTLSTTEMNADRVQVLIKDDTSGCVPFTATLYPAAAAAAHAGDAMALTADQAVNVTKVNGTAQTARDLGASVLISSGTGAGQLDVTSGVIKANLAQILGTALTETAGYLAAAFKQFFNVASPTGTMKAITNVVTTTTATNLTNLPAAAATAAELLKVPKSDSTVTWNATALAAINTQADLALSDYHPPTKAELDSGLAGLNDFDPTADVIARVTLVDTTTTNTDMRGTNSALTDKTGFSLTAAYDAAKAAAAPGAKMDLVDAPNATALTAVANAISSLATTGLAALKTLLDTTGIKVATNADKTGYSGTATNMVSAAPTASDNATAVWGAGTKALTDKSGFALSTAGVTAVWDALLTGISTAGSIGKLVKDYLDAAVSSRSTYAGGDTSGTTTLLGRIPGTVSAQTGDAYARLGAPAGASVSADVAAVKTDAAAVKLKTDNLPASPAAVGSAMTLASGAVTAAVIATDAIDADAIKTDAVTEIQSGLATAAELAKVPKSDSTVSWNATALGAVKTALEAAGSKLALIDAKTTNLPSDPADESLLEAAIAGVSGGSGASAEDVWEYGTRTLTSAGSGGATLDEIEGSDVLAMKADVTALNDFDPAHDTVARVTLVDTTTTNTDMRGTDGANKTAPDNAGIAAIKAKTDTLASLDGAFEYTVTDSTTGLPVAGVYVVASTDEEGANVVSSGFTDDFGLVRLPLGPGTWYLWRKRAGYKFDNPDVEEVVT